MIKRILVMVGLVVVVAAYSYEYGRNVGFVRSEAALGPVLYQCVKLTMDQNARSNGNNNPK